MLLCIVFCISFVGLCCDNQLLLNDFFFSKKVTEFSIRTTMYSNESRHDYLRQFYRLDQVTSRLYVAVKSDVPKPTVSFGKV